MRHTCIECGAEFDGRANALRCSAACNSLASGRTRRAALGIVPANRLMPAARTEDGRRRCVWCQSLIEHRRADAKTCGDLCRDRRARHNTGRSHSSTVMTVRL